MMLFKFVKKKKNGDRNKTLSQIVSIFHGVVLKKSDGRPTRSFLVAVFFVIYLYFIIYLLHYKKSLNRHWLLVSQLKVLDTF